MKGIKHDTGKSNWFLLPLVAVQQIVQVMDYGAKTYGQDNWKHLEKGNERMFAACLRHLTKWQTGERIDPETRLNHLAHAACCLVFMLWYEEQ